MSSAREALFGAIRQSLGVRGDEPERRRTVEQRLAGHPAGLIPQRGQRDLTGRVALFREMVEAAAGTVDQVADRGNVAAAIAEYLRSQNLPAALRRGEDARFAGLGFEGERTLEVSTGPSQGGELVGLSYAFGAIAESGTLMLVSGPDNPTTLNFLPDTHIVVVDAADIAGDYETLWGKLRARYGAGQMPRTVNLVTGPSRSADIGQTLILGAHGPRRLRVIVVGATD